MTVRRPPRSGRHAGSGGQESGDVVEGGGLRDDSRGVQWTLEAFLAVLLLLSALVVVAAVVPTGTGQADAELTQTQLQQAGDDVLALASEEGTLLEALLYWNATEGEFVGAEADLGGEPHYVAFRDAPDHPLAELLAGTLEERGVAYNVHLAYDTEDGTEQRPLAYQGPAGGDSVTASTTVLLRADERPVETPAACETLWELESCAEGSYYAPESLAGSDRHAVVEVELELWRT